MSQQSAIVQVDHNSLDNSTNFIEIQEMHIRKSERSREILPPKTTQNFVSPTDRNLSPCTKLLQAKKEKNCKNFKPVFLSNIFTKALKEDQEKQAKAEVSNMESSKDI
ncbi:unnamed protein product [Rhizophagus irregularis]|uniref:Uncharacterized protein n=3 Tax=Rhizophagus irregularis TaxID=588596 RepID=U9UUL6_RHIID|nr:hypothetical protein GLOIN_2v1625125 [Rhizophagus irregularis DAOM 181602=DAOM 197198]EXX53625.1 hypothetical protein RirG_242240 [Rhizophagus irregularis DAOM 197198w]PKC75006.1 hypothetical protein RhiirA1_408309 [Rhizophagus irregularis]PKY26643.1 hypothetical protein RhiirB3_415398 [Rhizophagus irregularis]PKY48478.1 hypothetical protein RhiirA4_464090 [Rhizophagus irregularis]POG69675.1 hypothetical protein GLOIN_2v1625125 [Rhizophagus irregularis DAOM 181602=DAOM 197198]|eukprot:XP_025176541.1 hypothetical protein GLOIN_2v1625125 [Rhizophagus irregularis DAOM 181602=DAOM 197198]